MLSCVGVGVCAYTIFNSAAFPADHAAATAHVRRHLPPQAESIFQFLF